MGSFGAHWELDPSLIYVLLAGCLYVLGGIGYRSAANAREEHLRELAFFAGLATIVIALDSPIDYYSDLLFWVHMGQHIILLTVAPPLILLGKPWPRMFRALPLNWRTWIGRTMIGAKWTAPIRALAQPVPAWILFSANLCIWHLPTMYNLTLQYGWIHVVEHALFFFSGLLFWAHVIDPGPIRHRMNWFSRAAYIAGAMVVGWVLAIILVIVPHPLYAHYADLAHRPGGISAIEDQQLAGGMMWVPGSVTYTIAVIMAFWRWVTPEAERHTRMPAAAL
jgi:putative membrane protein